MPNIPEYNLPSDPSKLRPDDTGAVATMRAGRIIQETARGIGDTVAQGYAKLGQGVAAAGKLADDYVTQHDIASAAEQHTAIGAQAAKDLPALLANSTDPVQAVQDYYDKTMQPAIDKINDSMNTKRSRMWSGRARAVGCPGVHS